MAAFITFALAGPTAASAARARLPIQTSVANYTRRWLIEDVARGIAISRFYVNCNRTTYTFRCVAVRRADGFILNGVRIWRKTRCVYVVTFLSAHLEPVWTKERSMC